MERARLINVLKGLESLGIKDYPDIFWNLEPPELIEEAIKNNEGAIAENGALVCNTGKFTTSSSKDRYIVEDDYTRNKVWWGDINNSFDRKKFDALYQKMLDYLRGKKLYVRDVAAGADPDHRLNIRVIDTKAWHNLFCHNMFLRLHPIDLQNFRSDFTLLVVPEFKADPTQDGTKSENFVIINFSRKLILVGGSGYTGEMKKGIFSVLNFILPEKENILSMHCSANMGKNGDTAIFFGLSGTGKSTLSSDPERYLIGDDEHGWTEKGIFNFEGGCYPRVQDLSQKNQPEIWDAIKFGAILENAVFESGTRKLDYGNSEITRNIRASYPIYHIKNSVEPSLGGTPKNIFFLTTDGFGVLPPISALTIEQAMYHFISGYTTKVPRNTMAEPQPIFSACFGAPFMPLHPGRYTELLGERIQQNRSNIWLINTGWTGGPVGTGSRIKLKYTRTMIAAALDGSLSATEFELATPFDLSVPTYIQDVPREILNPKRSWESEDLYERKAQFVASLFYANIQKYEKFLSRKVFDQGPETQSLIAS